MSNRLAKYGLALCALVISLHAWAAPGRTAGSYGVSPLGSAQYSIPIWVPPGIRGVQPNLNVSYDSRLGYGLMGPGWMLGGMSVIARCNPTFAQDSAPAPITLTTADGLCLDGNRLRSTGTGTYQTEIANFALITASGTAGNGPAYFTVKGKDGLTYEYGNTTDSRILPSSSVTTPYIWALDKVTDRSGNFMTFTYFQSGGAYVPLSIQYTAPSGSTTFPYKVSFTYTTKSANDTLAKYVASSQIKQTNQLSAITMSSSGTTVRVYKLSYSTSPTTLRARLASIQECGGSAGTDCLAATSVAYQNGTAGVASPATATGSGATNGTIRSVDVNDDGRKDLIFATTSGSNYQWWIQIASASGYGSPISMGITTVGTANFLIDDFDSTGKDEVLAPNGTTWFVYKWNGSTAFVGTTTNIPVVAGAQYSSADFDGDGRPDLLAVTLGAAAGTVDVAIRLNTTTGSTTAFAAAPVTRNVNIVSPTAMTLRSTFGNNQLSNSTVTRFDFDGDGRQDLLLSVLFRVNLAAHYVYVPLLGRGTNAPVVGAAVGNLNIAPQVVAATSWNDDACTDLVVDKIVQLSPCSGAFLDIITLTAIPSLFLDWDGDHRVDALYNSGGTWMLQRSQGTAAAAAVSTGISVGSGTWAVIDRDGDGLDDLLFANSANSNAISIGLHNGNPTRPDLATSFTDGYGVAFSPAYLPLSQTGYFSVAETYPEQNYNGPLNVVTSAAASDGIGASYSTTYYYGSAIVNLQGRGFEGFGVVGPKDSRTSIQEYKYYATAFPLTGQVTSGTLSTSSFKSLRTVTNQTATLTLDSTANNQRYFPYINSSKINLYETGGAMDGLLITTAETTYSTPDAYGNFPSVTTTLTDNDTGSPNYTKQWTTTTNISLTPNTTTWCLSLPTSTTVTNSSTAPNGAAITRSVVYNNPDYTNCRETQKVIEPSSSIYKVTEDYVYDTFGNLYTDTVTGIGMTARTTRITWNSTGQFPQTIQNPLLQSITLTFDANNGTKISQTDPNNTGTNPLKTTWAYDNFARELTETRPDGTSTATAYSDCDISCLNSNSKLKVTKTLKNADATTQTVQNTYLDGFGRVLVTSGLMLNSAYDRLETQYDALGRVAKQSVPTTFVSPVYNWSVYGYDLLNRISQSQRPISATNSTLQTTLYGYAGRTSTITDPLNHTSTKISLVTGNLAQSQDANAYYQNFGYDAFGSLLSVIDSASNTLFTAQYSYGLDAFQYSSTDTDLGSRSYTYNALGELTNWGDARGNSFSTTYDLLSRPLVRAEKLGTVADLTTTWTWGSSAASYNISKLQSVTAVSADGTYSDVYGFDSKTRPSTETITIPGDAGYTFTRTYNANTGLIDTLQYPISTSGYQLKLQYGYQNGILRQVSNIATGTQYWTANAINPSGEFTQETFGNGVVINRAMDAVTSWVGSIQAGIGSGAALQNNSYLFDGVGNLIQRQDNNLGTTENVYPDNLNRLDHTVGGSNTQMTYDGMGRILTRTAYGSPVVTNNFTTPQTGCTYYTNPQLHAVRSSTAGTQPPASTCYDANGNLIKISVSGVTVGSAAWTSFNKLNNIVYGTSSAQLFYGGDHQRYKQVANYAGAPETTLYVGGLLEKVINGSGTAYRHYIPAGSNMIVYTRLSTGSTPTYYITKDHLDSSAVITDQTGALVVKEKFGAWGINENTTTEQATIASVSRRQFTGQEQVSNSGTTSDFSIINMNGRVYNAVGGVFLSPDPYVPDPGNTQSFNRYSYVNNNPLSYIDPTGYDDTSAGGTLDEVVVTGSRIVDDAAGWVADLFSWIGGLFGGGGPRLSPSERAAVAHGVDLNTTLASNNNPTFSNGLAQNIQANPGSGVIDQYASSLGTDSSHVGITAYTTPAEQSDWLDTVNVMGQRMIGPNFAGIGRSSNFLAWKPLLNASAVPVLFAGNFMLGGLPSAASTGSVAVPFSLRSFAFSGGEAATLREGSFSIMNWAGYPAGLIRPSGPFSLVQGSEYSAARAAANAANRSLRGANPSSFAGRQIHEIQPVKFGGSPTDLVNKMLLSGPEHSAVTNWWNSLQRYLEAL